jgi:hypothetical protein
MRSALHGWDWAWLALIAVTLGAAVIAVGCCAMAGRTDRAESVVPAEWLADEDAP